MKDRVLIIDDEEGIRSSLKMILEYEGYDCVLAPTAQDGIASIEREAPDLVFLDIKMPNMDGLEALERIKASNETLPVVMISGHATVSTAVEATKKGAFDFIEKPLATDRVRSILIGAAAGTVRAPPDCCPAATRRRRWFGE